MAKQTINIGASPNDGTGTPLRTSFDYCNQNFTELYTATGPSGNNIVVPGTATITGDLTVDTNVLKVDSANNRVGLLTASPESQLDVRGLVAVRGTPTFPTTGVGLELFYSSTNSNSNLYSYNRGGSAWAAMAYGASSHTFQLSGSDAMTLNSTGLGVGVAPSAWQNSVKAVQVGTQSAAWQYSSTLFLTNNRYFDGANKYIGNGYSLSYHQNPSTGTHEWYYSTNNSSGAGAALTPVEGMRLDASGNLLIGTPSAAGNGRLWIQSAGSTAGVEMARWTSSTINNSFLVYVTDAEGFNGGATALKVGKNATTSRSINAGGTVNASGADYAEYMVKCGDFVLAKGDVAGIDANGKLTNVFADAVSFVVKSTDPSYVGNDKWGVGLEGADLESARQLVDRIAFAGQVPVNVTGAKAGDYIVPVVNGTGIKGQAVSNPTFEQYQLAVGKVISIDADGRARIIVKVA